MIRAMENEVTEKKSVDFAGEVINLIIDKSGRIIAHGPEFRRLIPAALPNIDFFDLFEDEKRKVLQRIFIDSKRAETISFDFIDLNFDNRPERFQVSFFPLRSENNIYFLVSFVHSDKIHFSSETRKFWFAASEIDKLADDSKLISVFNKIKLTYPFTFIEKAKIQKEINELSAHFWVKDPSGRYLIVNDKFAAAFGFKPVQIENKFENDFLPKFLTELYKTVDQYVIESANAVVIEGISVPVLSSSDKNVSLVEFPLCDLDNKVIALIGFSKSGRGINLPSNKIGAAELLSKLALAIVLLDGNNHIVSYSQEFVKLFELNEKTDYTGIHAANLFEKGFNVILEGYLGRPDSPGEYSVNYVFIEKIKLNVEVRFVKIFNPAGEFCGTQISFNPKLSEQGDLEAKAKMYDGLITQLSEAMFIYDTENLKFLEVNDAALKLYGYKRNDFLGMDLTDLYAPEDIQTLISSGDSKSVISGFSGPWRQKKADGSSILVEINRSTIEFMGKKAHLNIVKDVSDTTEQKKRQQILEASYENSGDVILLTDKDGFITEMNEVVTRRLGYAKRDLETRPFVSLVSDNDRAKVNKVIFHSGIMKTASIEVELKKPNGAFQKATVIATPVKNFSGEVENYNLILRFAEEQQIKDIKQAVIGTTPNVDAPFLSNVFHEILTPINVILGFTQELGESIPAPNDEQREAIDIIQENQKLLLQIMDNAVEFSTLEQKVIKLQPEEIKFVDLLNELRENTKKTAESKRVEIAYGKISSSLTLETDKQRILSLLSLFIKFAVQITKENTIYLSASQYNNDYCAVGIKDGKNLITPFLLKAFTDIFAEDENLSRRNYGFSRFSVKLAKKLIELLSAQKETLVKDGEASEFALVFPLKFTIPDKEKMEVEARSPSKTSAVKKSEQELDIKDKKAEAPQAKVQKQFVISQLSCLYLEDQVDSQLLFKVQMKDLKLVEFAPSFESALPLLKTKKFDFIVMDINLQGEYNGLDALRIIQKMPGYKDVPIIASTAYIQPGARDSFIAAGFSEFVSKPLLRDKLLQVLKKVFS